MRTASDMYSTSSLHILGHSDSQYSERHLQLPPEVAIDPQQQRSAFRIFFGQDVVVLVKRAVPLRQLEGQFRDVRRLAELRSAGDRELHFRQRHHRLPKAFVLKEPAENLSVEVFKRRHALPALCQLYGDAS